MRFVFYTHSLISDWNHGNAHFLRGIMRDLGRRGHQAVALEPSDSWSRKNLLADQGREAVLRFHRTFPDLDTRIYNGSFRHAELLQDADVVIVHEWTDPAVIALVGALRRRLGFKLLFHDTHHRAVSASSEMASLDLEDFDGILAFGEALREQYLARGWGDQVFTWHEAADDTVFRPLADLAKTTDLIWVGNWGDGERTSELEDFLIGPSETLGLHTKVYGVRYPDEARDRLAQAGIGYGGWIPNCDVPAAFAGARATVHIPRRPYRNALPGIPTIRPFEAMACGIPLISAPWDDCEALFSPGADYLVAPNRTTMERQLLDVLRDRDMAAELSRHGLQTIRARHTCHHRVDELLSILSRLGTPSVPAAQQPKELAE